MQKRNKKSPNLSKFVTSSYYPMNKHCIVRLEKSHKFKKEKSIKEFKELVAENYVLTLILRSSSH